MSERKIYLPMLYKYSNIVLVWPFTTKNRIFKATALIHFTIGLYFVIGILSNSFTVLKNFKQYKSETIIEAVYASICGINIYYNHTLLYLIRKNSLKLFEELQDFSLFDEPSDAIKHLFFVDLLNIITLIYVAIGLLFVIVSVNIQDRNCTEEEMLERNLICGFVVQVKYFYSINRGFLYYLHWFIEKYSLMFLLSGGALCGSTCFSAVELLIVRLDHLKQLISEIFNVNNDKERHRRLKDCIRYHIHIIELLNKTNICYEELLAPCPVTYSVIIGINVLSVLTRFDLRAFVNVIGWVLAILMICISGERMIVKSLDISTALYDTKWYEGNVSIRRDIAFMMMRSQKPLCLKSGPYGIISLLTFKSIMKGAYTYATMQGQSQNE